MTRLPSIEDDDFRADILDVARFTRNWTTITIGLMIDEDQRITLDDADEAAMLRNAYDAATTLIDDLARLGYGNAVDIRRVQADDLDG